MSGRSAVEDGQLVTLRTARVATNTERRRVVLVDFYWTRDKDPRVPLGHGSLLAALRADDRADVYPIALPVNLQPATAPEITNTILGYVDGLPAERVDVAIGVYVWAEELVQQVLATLRTRGYAGRIILGGPQITYAGSDVALHYPHADVFVRGYGESALCKLAITPGLPRIPGVLYAGEPDRCEQTQLDLALLPSPWLGGVIPLGSQRFIRWETQRGCGFSCTFCQHREPDSRLRARQLSLDRIEREIDLFCSDRAIEEIAVLDPIFNMHPHATAILERFTRGAFGGHLSLQCRAEGIDQQFLDTVQQLDACLEFGLQTIHPREGAAVKRRNNLPKVDEALADVRARGIHHEVSLIFGLPDQTLASFVGSVKWCLERRVPVIKAFPLMLLRGTALEQDRAKWGLVEDGNPMPMVIASHTFSPSASRTMAAIAEALRRTEGNHPAIEDLLALARCVEPSFDRWHPAAASESAAP